MLIQTKLVIWCQMVSRLVPVIYHLNIAKCLKLTTLFSLTILIIQCHEKQKNIAPTVIFFFYKIFRYRCERRKILWCFVLINVLYCVLPRIPPSHYGNFYLGCLHPVACIRSGIRGFCLQNSISVVFTIYLCMLFG
jgi:hypothetical protein